MKALKVINPGPLSLVEDRGRSGQTGVGVGRSGAMDRAALALANRLVGNPKNAAGLEILLGGAQFEAIGDLWIAVTGSWGLLEVDGRRAEPNTTIRLTAGSRLSLPISEHGLRYYLAIRGGVEVDEVLGSRSRDTLAMIGPSPLKAGDELPIGISSIDPIPIVDSIPVELPDGSARQIQVRPGPRRGWFGPESWNKLFEAEWVVSQRSDRRGIRIDGPVLGRVRDDELLSEGMLTGAIQVSPDGVPTILGVDHPVTGGYPVIAAVTDPSFDALAQVRPGQIIKFRLATGR